MTIQEYTAILTCFSLFGCCTIGSIIFEKHNINIDIHTRMNTHLYEYMYVYSTSILKVSEKHRVDALEYCGINLVSLCARSDWTKMLPVMQEVCVSSVPD
jgi:hypothetical protein